RLWRRASYSASPPAPLAEAFGEFAGGSSCASIPEMSLFNALRQHFQPTFRRWERRRSRQLSDSALCRGQAERSSATAAFLRPGGAKPGLLAGRFSLKLLSSAPRLTK